MTSSRATRTLHLVRLTVGGHGRPQDHPERVDWTATRRRPGRRRPLRIRVTSVAFRCLRPAGERSSAGRCGHSEPVACTQNGTSMCIGWERSGPSNVQIDETGVVDSTASGSRPDDGGQPMFGRRWNRSTKVIASRRIVRCPGRLRRDGQFYRTADRCRHARRARPRRRHHPALRCHVGTAAPVAATATVAISVTGGTVVAKVTTSSGVAGRRHRGLQPGRNRAGPGGTGGRRRPRPACRPGCRSATTPSPPNSSRTTPLRSPTGRRPLGFAAARPASTLTAAFG